MHASLLAFALALQAPAGGQHKQAAYARVARARSIAHDPQLLAFVVAKNAAPESPDEIHRKDGEWAKPGERALHRAVTQGECAARLRALVAADPVIVEAMVMDQRGALVCASVETSDYWQGDEPKWQKTCQEGRDPFVDELGFDASTNQYAVQLSVPIVQEGERVGALSLTLRVPRELAAPQR